MKIFATVLAVGLSLLSSVQAEERPQDYRQLLPLTLEGEGPWYRLELPMAVHYAAQHADLRDLRIFNGAGQAQAYALLPGQSESRDQEQEHGVRWFPLYADAQQGDVPRLRVQRSSDGTLIELSGEEPAPAERQLRGWLFDASAIDAPLVRMSLGWNGVEEGFQHFTIEASDDLQHWRGWGEGQVARLSFAGDRIDQRQVELPARTARYIRLLWSSPRQAPELDAVTLRSRRQASSPAPLIWSEPMPAQAMSDGHYQWQLPQALVLQRLRINLEEPNTLAPVRFEARAAEKDRWRALASGVLYRLPQDGGEARQDELPLPAWPVRQVRMKVDARGGGLGQQTPTASFAVRATQVVFLARGEPPYRLATGRAAAASAALPVGTLIPGYSTERLASLALARVDVSAVPSEVNAPASVATDWKRWGLWAVLLLGVVLLAAMAASLLRRPEKG
ncbi:DUF3999 domain-containing protein [Pseudomonas sp. Z8(2022)]|uniref:DUF3999 domain-containing protein n=1 Tax=Pseudomonas sp. Z8(2022) TaxID=2962597 RepID=UPI0021F4F303|nr:DUF3999 domain-containing protein [Pseudomonas sp. Z8(2022)]UYP30069.1 DUF3999 domain-containing protein [Pseudomonas sp. Z8(2022)]